MRYDLFNRNSLSLVPTTGTASLKPVLAVGPAGEPGEPGALPDDATIAAAIPAATTVASGKVELATTAEAATGTDAVRAVTPAGALASLFANFNNAAGFMNVKNQGVKGDWRTLGGGNFTAGSTTLTVDSYTFTSADVGKVVVLFNAATLNTTTQPQNYTTAPGAFSQPGNMFWTTILSVSAGAATLAAAPTVTRTNERVMFGTDDTAALQAALDLAAAQAEGGGDLRAVFLPQGWYRVRQIVIPVGVRLFGVNWGEGYGNVTGPGTSKKNGTFIQQLEGAQCDLMVFKHSLLAASYWVGPCEVRDIILQGPYTGTIGSGVKAASITDVEAGAVVTEGFFLDNVQAGGFPEHGFEFPCGASTLYTRGLRPFYNGKFGIYFGTASGGSAQSVHFLDTTGDGNCSGLFGFDGMNGGGTRECVVTITNAKSEAAGWDLLSTPTWMRRTETGKQLTVISINNCRNTFNLRGIAHLSAATDRAADSTGATYYAPGPVITLTGAARPYITWSGVGVRDMAGARVDTNTADMVLLRDTTAGIDVPIAVTEGSYQGRGSGGGWGNKGTPNIDYGEPGARVLISVDPGSSTVPTTYKASSVNERPRDQLAGPTPTRSWVENDGTSQSKHWLEVLSAGEFSLQAVDDDAAAAAKIIRASRDTSKNATLLLGGTGASDKLGFFGGSGVVKQTVTGSRMGGGALAALLTGLGNYAAVTDSSTGAIQTWAGSTAYAAFDLIRLPTGGVGYQTAARTSRATWDATERDFWTFLAGGHMETISAGTTSWKAPLGVTKILALDLLAGGGGGCGGGSAVGAVNQTGGAGGAAGERVILRNLTVTATTSYVCAVGAGGAGGAGGAAGGNNAGAVGTKGGETNFNIGGTVYKAGGGNVGTVTAGGSTASASSGNAGGVQISISSAGVPGAGGPCSSTFAQAPAPLAGVVGGSGGGPAASGTLKGGLGGNARTTVGGNPSGVGAGGSADGSGGNGTTATELGCGGGGGGGGNNSLAGGTGGAGAAGVIVIEF